MAKISRSYTISGMERLIAVAIGGAVGALLRYGIALWAGVSWQTAAGRFPIGTFVANVIGGLLIGILFQLFRQISVPLYIETLLLTGFLGALTTFSTFGLEIVRLYQDGFEETAMGYLLLTNLAVILAVAIGINLTKQFA
ncbi:MAG: CrcB family protein [Anaerolineales bacterium]|nr:CrcB family protein [Anaerolineales bacterium]